MDALNVIVAAINNEVSLLSIILLIFAGVSVVVASGVQLYMKIRPRFPIRVNCWFCNKNTDIIFSKRNMWDCPYCEQYNGFLQDGGYNKVIPAQSDELLNHPVTTVKRKPFKTDDNGLCRKCNINQELKVQQLASFSPIDNANFDEEVELYRERLEKAYQLCEQCDVKTSKKLTLVRAWLKNLYHNHVNKSSDHFSDYNKKNSSKGIILRCVNYMCCAMSLIASIGLCVALSARVQPLLELELNVELQSLLAESLKYETVLGLSASLLMLCCLLTGPCWLAPELLPSALWGLATYCSIESNQPDSLLSQQFLANAQAALIPTALLTTIWSHVKHYKTSVKQANTRQVGKVQLRKSMTRHEFSDDEDVSITSQTRNNGSCASKTSIEPPLLEATIVPPSEKVDPIELQTGLNELSLGPLLQSKTPTPSLFEPRIYQTSNLPEFINSPSMASSFEEGLDGNWGPRQRKPVLSPARLQLNNLTHSSWVAGGYWQNHVYPSPPSSFYNSFPPSSFPLSRSSSQSSGFASQGGTNYSSLPNSRTGSVCEADRFSVLSEPMYPSYSPPLPSYCCYVAAPHPPAFFFSPLSSPPSPMPSVPSPEEYTAHQTDKQTEEQKRRTPPVSKTNSNDTITARQKSVLALVKENFFLATLFFSSIVFNVVVIAFAAMNTFKVH